MPTIGGFSVTVWQGWLHPATRKIAVLDTAFGVDGNAVARGGYHNDVHEVRTIVEGASVAAVAQLYNQYRALEGTTVTVVDQFGITWPSVVVIRVTAEIAAVGYNSRFRLTASWRLLPVTTRPT